MDGQREIVPFHSPEEESTRILVVDDEPIIREILSDYLVSLGYETHTAENGLIALEMLGKSRFDLVMTDLKMPVMGGAELLAHMAKRKIKVNVVVMTAFATVETAIQTMKNGAYDYIMKPFKIHEITVVVERALEKGRLERENILLKEAKRLYEISEAMNATLALDKVLTIIVQSAKRESDADLASLVLWDKKKRKWRSEILDTEILSVSPQEIEETLDLETLRLDHLSAKPVVYPPVNVQRYLRRRLPDGVVIRSFLSVPLSIQGEVNGMLNVFSFTEGQVFLEGQRKSLYVLASRAANAIENAQLHEELKTMFVQTIEGFAFALDAKDPYTHGHSRRVTRYCELIAQAMGMEESKVDELRHAAMLHDIGKIGLKLESLNKPGRLTHEEEEVFRTHPRMGCKILKPIQIFEHLIPIIYHHHERYDGSGYPEGKQGEEIPLSARILAVADAFDAMTSNRSYREAMTEKEAVQELQRNSGSQFDPRVVETFVRIIRQSAESAEENGYHGPIPEARPY